MEKIAYLIMVDSNQNNNKFYKMIQKGSEFIAEWGRVGTNPRRSTYSMNDWNKKYRSKLNKGYSDKTHLLEEQNVQKIEQKYKEISNKEINDIVQRLQANARKTLQQNYTISSNQVTLKMINQANEAINELFYIDDLSRFNENLVRLFEIIPRKMSKVKLYLINDIKEKSFIIEREKDLLEVMRGQITIDKIKKNNKVNDKVGTKVKDKTILEILNIEIKPITKKDEKIIKDNLGKLSNKFKNAWIVINKKTQKKYNDYIEKNKPKKEVFYWHGSRNENWWNILSHGLLLKPDARITGKMFGNAIYFACEAMKSFGYTSTRGSYWARGTSSSGFMGLYQTAYNNPLHVNAYKGIYSSLDFKGLKDIRKDVDCMYAHKGNMLRNDEIMFYQEEQVNIKYLVELEK